MRYGVLRMLSALEQECCDGLATGEEEGLSERCSSSLTKISLALGYERWTKSVSDVRGGGVVGFDGTKLTRAVLRYYGYVLVTTRWLPYTLMNYIENRNKSSQSSSSSTLISAATTTVVPLLQTGSIAPPTGCIATWTVSTANPTGGIEIQSLTVGAA